MKPLTEILEEFLIWHWQQFQTGKFEKLGHIPHSGATQEEAKLSIRKELLGMLPKARGDATKVDYRGFRIEPGGSDYALGYNQGIDELKQKIEEWTR